MAFTLADLKKAQGITVTPKSSGSNFKLSDVKAAIAKPAQTTSQPVTTATFPKTTVKPSALFNPVTNPIPASQQPLKKQEFFQPLQKTLAQTPPTPSPYTTEHPETISKTGDEILKFAAKTGVATLNILASGLDFTTDLVAKNLVTKKEDPQSILQPKFITNLNDKWLKWYNEKEAKGEIYSQKIQKFVDTLSQSDYVQNRPEWEALDIKQKLSKENIGETILNLAPSVIASVATFAVNPTFGFVVSATSTAQDVKEGAVKEGVDPQKAEKLGLATGLIVGFLDKIVPDEVFNNKETKKFFIKEFLKNLVRRTVTEAGTEIAQEDIQMIAEETFRDISKDEKEQRRVMSGLGGALGGTGFSVLGDFSNITINEDILEKNPSGTTPSTINPLTEENVSVKTEEAAQEETPPKAEEVKPKETPVKEEIAPTNYKDEANHLLEKQEMTPAEMSRYSDLGDAIKLKDDVEFFTKQIARAKEINNESYIDETQPILDRKIKQLEELDKKLSQTPVSTKETNEPKTYRIIKEEGIVEVKGTPVKIIDGIDTFIHEGTGGWVVSESSTGRYIADSRTQEGAIAKANFVISGNEEEFRQLISKHKLPNPKPTPEVKVTKNKKTVKKPSKPVATRGEKQKVSPAVKKLAKKLGVSLDNKYSPSKNRSQIIRANKFYDSKPKQALEVALGLRTPPKGILEEAIRIVAEERAIKSKNTQQLIDIARADVLSGRRTAQELQIRAARDPLSPINLLGSVLAEKQKRIEKKTGKTTKTLVKEETAKLKDSITKTQPKVRDWTSFLEEIKCK